MSLDQPIAESLERFVNESDFASGGGIVTDLDGTALHEDAGRIFIPKPVEFGFKALHDLGRPFVLNTLRFPLSVLRTFGRDWYSISSSPIPTVTLNGSLIGYVTRTDENEMAFNEIAAFPLKIAEIDEALDLVEQLIAEGAGNILLFYYPRDWRMGEIIWTPVADRVLAVKDKYPSASSVTAVELAKLRDQMHAEEICMIFLLVAPGGEKLMAYQHTHRNDFFTAAGVDKLSGAKSISEHLGFQLDASLGAGDTELDRFLSGVGLAVVVGHRKLKFRGVRDTIQLKNSFEFGDLLFRLAEMVRAAR
jgi:hydroxymethylpyrimidine pyrophosphatase-like HAD family hydrolase